jgi:hypothetical protein
MNLIIDKLVMNETPQSGTWLMCFQATAGGSNGTFNVPDKEYEGDGITIDMGIRLPNVGEGQTCAFSCKLDDDQDDVCGDAEDQSSGSFTATVSGSQAFNPADDWSYVVHWHME